MISRIFGTALHRSDSNRRPQRPTLPAELIDHILEYLELDIISRDPTPKSRATAFACCRVSRQFLPFGRRMLYAKVLVTYKKGAKSDKHSPMKRLVEVNDYRNPELLANTTSIVIRDSLSEAHSLQGLLQWCNIVDLSLPWGTNTWTHLMELRDFGTTLQTLRFTAPPNATRFRSHQAISSGFGTTGGTGPQNLRRLSLSGITDAYMWSIPSFYPVREMEFSECLRPVVTQFLERYGDRLTRLELAATTIDGAFHLLNHTQRMTQLKTLIISFLRTSPDIDHGTQSWRASIVSFLASAPELEELELRFTKKTADVVFGNKRPELCVGLPDGVQKVVVRVIAEGGGDGDGTVERRRTDLRCEQHGKDYVCYGQEVF